MLGEYGLSIDYIVIGLSVATLILLVIIINLLVSINKLKKRYNKFMSGDDGQNLEEKFADKFHNINIVSEENKAIKVAIKKISEIQKDSITKIGIVNYDAFNEETGKLSFVIVLLNDLNNGIIFNSVYSSRSGCYLYAKELVVGKSEKALTKEEKDAIRSATNGKELIN